MHSPTEKEFAVGLSVKRKETKVSALAHPDECVNIFRSSTMSIVIPSSRSVTESTFAVK